MHAAAGTCIADEHKACGRQRAGASCVRFFEACLFVQRPQTIFGPQLLSGIAYDFLFPFVQIDSLTCKAQKEFQVFARILKRNFKD